VYVNGQALYLASGDGTASRKLVNLPWPLAGFNVDTSAGQNVNTSPVWSPDGQKIALTVVNPEGRINQLWEVSGDGTDLHQMFPGWHAKTGECCGSWMPNGKYFVFTSQRQIWAARQAGSVLQRVSSEPVQLTAGAVSYSYPVPGKDGKTIFAVASVQRGELQSYNRKSRSFEPFLGGISAQDVAFTKDGDWVAYVSYPDRILWRSKVDGSNKVQLSFPPVYAMLPRWSPAGKEIVYFGLEDGKSARIYEVSADGGVRRQLMPDQSGNQADPVWSPTGDALAFGETGSGASAEIHILQMKTGQITTLPGSQGLYSPRWSPDGRYIAALPFDESGIKLFDLNAQKWSMLVKGLAGYPCWSHDGRFIYFLRMSDNVIDRVTVPEGKIEQVASFKGFQITGFYTFWLALASDDSPLVLKDAGTQEVVSMAWLEP
jgi:Tol biopolymer transport system component